MLRRDDVERGVRKLKTVQALYRVRFFVPTPRTQKRLFNILLQ